MLKRINNLDGLAGLAKDWDRLADRQQQPLLRHDWFVSAAEAFHGQDTLQVLAVERDGRVAAIAPLVEVRRGGFKWLELIGAGHLHEPCGLLHSDDLALEELLRAIARLGRPLHLQRLPVGSSAGTSFGQLPRSAGLRVRRRGSGAVYVPISGGWDDYYQGLSSKRRYDLRRARRRFGDARLETQLFCPAPEELDAAFATACQVEAASWKGRQGSSLLDNPRASRFFSQYLRRSAEAGTLRMAFLLVDGEPCAMQIAVEAYRRLWVLKIGYDERWARCSPGVLLTEATLQDAFERGLESYEFLGSPEAWLSMWTRESRPHESLILYPISVRGLAALTSDVGDFARRRLATRLRQRQQPAT